MRLAVALFLVLALLPTSAARLYEGPATIEDAVVWEDDVIELNRTVTIAPNGSLEIRNVTLAPTGDFNWTAHGSVRPLMIALGPITTVNSSFSGNSTFTVVSSEVGASFEGSTIADSVYGIVSWHGNVSIDGCTLRDSMWGIYVLDGRLSIVGSEFDGVGYPVTASVIDATLTDVRIVRSGAYMAKFYSSSVMIDRFEGDTAADGIILRSSSGTVQAALANISVSNCETGGCSGYPATGAPVGIDSGTLSLVNTTVTSSDMGLGIYHATADVEGCHFIGLPAGVYALYASGSLSSSTFTDCGMGVEGYGIDLALADNTFVNTSVELREWWMSAVEVADPYGNSVGDAEVVLTDAIGSEVRRRTSAFGDADLVFIGRSIVNGSTEALEPRALVVSLGDVNVSLEDIEMEDGGTREVELPLWKPDLLIDDVTFSQKDGGKVRVVATIANLGDAPALDVRVDFTYTDGGDQRLIGTAILGTIPANSSVDAVILWDAEEGKYTVTAYAESSSDERDASANNNAASAPVDVEGSPADPMVLVIVAAFAVVLFILLAFLIRSLRTGPREDSGLPPMTWMEVAQHRTPHSRSGGTGTVKVRKPAPGDGRAPPAGRPPVQRRPPPPR